MIAANRLARNPPEGVEGRSCAPMVSICLCQSRVSCRMHPAHTKDTEVSLSCPQMLLSADRAHCLFCIIRRHFKFLSFKWERRTTFHRPWATPQIPGGNKATKVLILFDGTPSRVKEQPVWRHNSVFSLLSLPTKVIYPPSCRHLLTRAWTAATGLFPAPVGESRWVEAAMAHQTSREPLRTSSLEEKGLVHLSCSSLMIYHQRQAVIPHHTSTCETAQKFDGDVERNP